MWCLALWFLLCFLIFVFDLALTQITVPWAISCSFRSSFLQSSSLLSSSFCVQCFLLRRCACHIVPPCHYFIFIFVVHVVLSGAMYNFSSAVSSWVNYVLGIPCGFSQWRTHLQCRRCGLIPGLGRSLEKKMATHSSILAWEILWTKEPGRLLSIGSQRVGHNLATKPPTPSHILCKGENWGQNEVWSPKSSPFVLRGWVSLVERVLVLTGRCSAFKKKKKKRNMKI